MDIEEKKGAKILLSFLPSKDLESLLSTVTNNQIAARDTHEAIKVIVEFSHSAKELLKRKKINRELIFQYLVDAGIKPDVKSDKSSLIKQTIEHWNQTLNKEKPLNVLQTQLTPKEVNCDKTGNEQTSVNINVDLKVGISSPLPPSSTDILCSQGPQIHEILNPNQNVSKSFVHWFYTLLNSQNPDMPGEAQEYGAHHFWDDCTLQMCIRTDQQNIEESCSGSIPTAEKIHALAKNERLLFQPNLSPEGILCKSSPHGMLLILVCGTIHKNQTCVGVFDHVFGLVRDPRFQNNWKPKLLRLKMMQSNAEAMPSISNHSLAEIQDLMAV